MFPLDPYKSVQATGTERIITMEDPVGFLVFSFQSVQTQENHLTSSVRKYRIFKCAPGRDRTFDLRIRNPLLYPLSYGCNGQG
jgi:hypothetical protein